MSSALASEFPTTGPPGRSLRLSFWALLYLLILQDTSGSSYIFSCFISRISHFSKGLRFLFFFFGESHLETRLLALSGRYLSFEESLVHMYWLPSSPNVACGPSKQRSVMTSMDQNHYHQKEEKGLSHLQERYLKGCGSEPRMRALGPEPTLQKPTAHEAEFFHSL